MQKIALSIQYDGARYSGWQYQNERVPTVQAELEKALCKVAGGESIKTFCAGRTDAGVHASAQVVHFEVGIERELKAWTEGVNTLLPKDISVQWAGFVDEGFHARFSALSRRYRYFICNTRYRPALNYQNLSWHRYPLDAKLMHDSAQVLLGENDFQAFRASGCQSRSSYRYLKELNIKRKGDLILIDIEANAFLLHMVRNIVGVLLDVGEGRKHVSWVKEVLDSKDRTQAGITAAPNGLHLVQVTYPENFGIPKFVVPDYSQS